MTILGSCVAVCIWDPESGAGGVSHFVLPEGRAGGESPARFGNVAVEQLVDELVDLGSSAECLRAKLFGGAAVLSSYAGRIGTLGFKNVIVARNMLTKFGIPIAAEDVGGDKGRKLIFHLDTGDAWVKRI